MRASVCSRGVHLMCHARRLTQPRLPRLSVTMHAVALSRSTLRAMTSDRRACVC